MASSPTLRDMTSPSASTSSQPIKFDLIGNLLPYPHILEKVFCYLHPKDLRVVPCVCHKWQEAVYVIAPVANRRRVRSVKHLKKVKRRVGTENWPLDLECASLKRRLRNQQRQDEQQEQAEPAVGLRRSQRRTLSSIQNVVTENHKLFKRKIHVEQRDDEIAPEEGRKKSRWTLACEPFKRW